MRVLAIAASLLALGMAGCTGGGEDTGPGAAADERPGDMAGLNSTFAPAPVALVPVTGTLHFLARPTLSVVAPTGTVERVALPDTTSTFTSNVLGLSPPPESWTIPWPDDGARAVAGNATLWVDVQGQVLNTPHGEECFWSLIISFFGESEGTGFGVCAGNEPTQVPSGPRRLDIEFRFEGDIPADADLSIQLYAGIGPHAQGTERVLLVGSAEHDSSITFQGMTFD